MELLRLKTADVRPNGMNPRTDFSSVERLAENLAATGGEPVNPIVVMRDGDAYRILDGERRWRAMQKNGQDECTAVVCDGWDDADQVLAALSSDDKEPLSAVERSRGLQEFMDLGDVSDDKLAAAEVVSGVKTGTVRRIRRVRDRAGERAANMTIDQLLAASEFEDDPDAMDRVLSAQRWQTEAENIKAERKREKKIAEMRGVLEAHGVRVFDERPEGLREMHSSTDTKRLDEWLSENGGPLVLGGYVATSWFEGARCTVFGEKDSGMTAEEKKRAHVMELEDEAKELRSSILSRALTFVAERAVRGVKTDLSDDLDDVGEYPVSQCVSELESQGFDTRKLETTWAHSFNHLWRAFAMLQMHWMYSEVNVDQCHLVADTIEALEREGFAVTDGDRRLAEIAKSLLEEDQEDGE